MLNIYIKQNHDWDWETKLKYGYVCGTDEKLSNRLCDSREEHSELSQFTAIYAFEKTKYYKLTCCYTEIDKILSLIAPKLEKIKIVEEIYGISLPFLRKLNEHLVNSKSKRTCEFIYRSGLPLLDKILKKHLIRLVMRILSIENKKVNL